MFSSFLSFLGAFRGRACGGGGGGYVCVGGGVGRVVLGPNKKN